MSSRHGGRSTGHRGEPETDIKKVNDFIIDLTHPLGHGQYGYVYLAWKEEAMNGTVGQSNNASFT